MFTPDSSFIVLYTTNVTKTHDFYQAIGAQIKELVSDKVVVGLGSLDLHFVLNTSEPQESYRYIAKSGNYEHGVIFYTQVDSIELAKQQILAAGGTIKADIYENHWGSLELLFEDPNGYKFALYQEKLARKSDVLTRG